MTYTDDTDSLINAVSLVYTESNACGNRAVIDDQPQHDQEREAPDFVYQRHHVVDAPAPMALLTRLLVVVASAFTGISITM